ncbi:MAG: GAF domain-containing protein [Chloroflexi bacterium]|nr:GAF domain-containing protein [Chloroflexota bacterium]
MFPFILTAALSGIIARLTIHQATAPTLYASEDPSPSNAIADELIQAVLNNLEDGVFLLTTDHYIVDLNDTAVSISDLPAEEIIGEHISQILSHKIDLIIRDIKAGKTDSEIQIGCPGQQKVYTVNLKPLPENLPHPARQMLVLCDITARKSALAQLQRQRDLFVDMVSVARVTAQDAGLHEVLRNAMEIATGITQAQYGSLLVLDEDFRIKESILHQRQATTAQRDQIITQVLDEGIAGWVVEHCQPVLIHDTQQDERWMTLPEQPYVSRSVLSVPIFSNTRIAGILTLEHPEPHHFTAEHAGLMQAAADQIALVMSNAQAYEIQRRQARQQDILVQFLRSTRDNLNLDDVTRTAVQTIQQLTGWTAVTLLMLEDDGNQLTVQSSAGDLPTLTSAPSATATDIYSQAFQAEKTIITTPLDQTKSLLPSQTPFQSSIATPLLYRGHKFGVLAALADQPDSFREHDIWLIEALAEATALTIANARLFQKVMDERSRLQSLMEANRDGIVMVGMDRRLLVINDKAVEYLNLTQPSANWVNLPMRRALTELQQVEPAAYVAFMSEIRRIGAGNNDVNEHEFSTSNGIIQWMSVPVMADNISIGRLIILRDITEERQLEKMREDLIQTTVHDLRNPLGAAFSAVEFLRDLVGTPEESDVNHLLEMAQHSTGKALNLVNTLLDINRLEIGQMPVNYTLLRLPNLIEETLANQQSLAHGRNIALKSNLPDDLPFAWADAELVERVLQNLVDNALKFTPSQGEIVVLLRHNPETEKLLVSVSDTGSGIAHHLRQRLFEKFSTGYQLHGKPERGSGLGLAFCQMALEAHGERIWLDESVGTGTRFTFSLTAVTLDITDI